MIFRNIFKFFQNLPSGVLIEIESQFKMPTTFFCANSCAISCEKNRYFWMKPVKQLDWRKKNETIVNMIAKVFNHSTFFGKKKWKSIKSLFTFFTKRSFFWFDLFSQTFLSIRNGFVHLWKKKQQWKQKKQRRQKKRKGRAFKLFFVTSCLYATFFNLRASSLHKNLSFAFPHRKKMKNWDYR